MRHYNGEISVLIIERYVQILLATPNNKYLSILKYGILKFHQLICWAKVKSIFTGLKEAFS